MKSIGIIIVIATLGLTLSLVGLYISATNSYVDLENSYTKQKAKIETFHDKMWKTIKSQAGVKDSYKKDFKDVYTSIMQGRYSSGSKDGSLMKWIQESNPNFDSTLYTKLMTTIEAQRTGFFAEQDIMQQIVKEMNDLRRKFPSSLFLGSKPEASFTPISSTVSKQIMESGTDDDLYLD